MHLTSLRIDDEDYDYILRYGLKITEIFKIGLAQIKMEMLESAYDELAKLQKKVYNLQQKIYILEQENIYKNGKNIYNLESLFKNFSVAGRDKYSDEHNLVWLETRIKKLRKNGISYSAEKLLDMCKRYCRNAGGKKLDEKVV